MISQLIDGQQNQWDELLAEITLAINSSVFESTGYSPAFLVQGRQPRLPGGLYDEVTPEDPGELEDHGNKAKRLQEIFTIVRGDLDQASHDQSRHYNLRRRQWRPTLGGKVLLRQHHLSNAADGFAANLAPKFDGPYVVKKFIAANIVRL
ncbi:uncharacterized protein LOC127565804 [Drosophila albomicans]|uniref:Uncharacterized protein LOC127565804 n=1 Tax=Drosophila albomicans TaxID=7291 RepID=A0A9C6WCB8_DROAB|nr:uncharacterized protein LOC127565804 [Drosophila albomicans]